MMVRKLRVSALAILTGVLGLVLSAGLPAGARGRKCLAAKLKAIGRSRSGLLLCAAKGATRGASAEAACITEVGDEFSRASGERTGCAALAPPDSRCASIADACRDELRAALPDGDAMKPSRCEAARLKAAGKNAAAKLTCYAKAAARGIPVDSSPGGCLDRANVRFMAAFRKVCSSTGDASGSGEKVAALIDSVCVAPVVTLDAVSRVTGICPAALAPTNAERPSLVAPTSLAATAASNGEINLSRRKVTTTTTTTPLTTTTTAPPATTPTFIQGAAFATAPISAVTVTLTRPVARGDLLVGWFSQYHAPGKVQVSDNVNGTWTRAPRSLTFQDDTGDIALYYRENSQAAPGGMTITVSDSSSAYLQGSVAEYSGVALAGSLDQIVTARGVGTLVDTGATAPVGAGELAFAALVTGGSPSSVAPASSLGVAYTPRARTSTGSFLRGGHPVERRGRAARDRHPCLLHRLVRGLRRLPSPSRHTAPAALHADGARGHERGLHTGRPLVVTVPGQRRRPYRVPKRLPHRDDTARRHDLRGLGRDAIDHLHVFGRRFRPGGRSFGAVGTPDGRHTRRVARIHPGSGGLTRHPPRVGHPEPDRAGPGRRPPGGVVQPVQRRGSGARLGQREWSMDALDLDDVGRSGRHRPLLPGEFSRRTVGPRDHRVGVRARLSAGGGRGLQTRGRGGSPGTGRRVARRGKSRQRGSDRRDPRRRAGPGRRDHRQPNWLPPGGWCRTSSTCRTAAPPPTSRTSSPAPPARSREA